MKTKLSLPFLWNSESTELTSLPELLQTEKSKIKSMLVDNGAILFKSYNIDNAEKLEACVNAFSGNSMDYIDGNSPRTKLHGKVYTSTEHPPEEFISLHNELSYGSQWPNYLFFCCVVPALKGGSTAVADSRAILSDLSENTRMAFKEKGVEYIRNLHGGFGAGPSWQDTFETDSEKDVENYCKLNDIQFEWKENNALRLIQKRKAIIEHPNSKEEVWFNQADQFHPSTNSPEVYEALMEIYEGDPKSMPQYATFGDGNEIPLDMLEEIRSVSEKNMIVFEWEKGDLMLVDNINTAHGRTPFEGPRKILVSMSS
ncbi:TauD/TfdA family dioxygenase [Aquimarina gracilis]|uniref:TauD/TfdA family dioxygenase n=1 Tax=Aquimarina gracilis TaxID=874422 RepID=A0ABU5ZSM9_9FLAO|nr:TauD/TfdA family dioxygenase [Aquimarina gracilis]MEB3344959.1 TauD/TfdA family dioxygenase [Aquimarina gracilis]